MFSRALIQNSTLSIQHFVSVLSDFIHVDDFRGLPQILLLSIRQRFHPIIIRLFTELIRLCRHSRFLLGRRRISLLWRLLSFSLLGRIHINGHGNSNMIEIQCHPAQVKSQWSKVVVSEGKLVFSSRLFKKAVQQGRRER